MPFTRPPKFYRRFNPVNVIGSLIGYGDCDCGNTLWRSNNSGYMTSYHSGRVICNACYRTFKDAIINNDQKRLDETPSYWYDGAYHTTPPSDPSETEP